MLFSSDSPLWSDPRLVYGVAVAAVLFLAATIWLFRRSKRDGRGAGFVCLILSVLLHGALIWLVPYQAEEQGGSANQQSEPDFVGVDAVNFSTFEDELPTEDTSADAEVAEIAPLPVSEMEELIEEQPDVPEAPEPEVDVAEVPQQLAAPSESVIEDIASDLDEALDDLLDEQMAVADQVAAEQELPDTPSNDSPEAPAAPQPPRVAEVTPTPSAPVAEPNPAMVPGMTENDFANRTGAAKQLALHQTGGDLQTEAAVQAALRFLAASQRSDGAWDPQSSGAGVERRPLGESRFGAGTRCDTGITGLSLLAMMGAGNTHLRGDYAENVYQGLAYLIRTQKTDGSLGGGATLYASSYCHSMAALALCECAAITQDAAAIESSKRAIQFTTSMQHPVTGGWRYTKGDPGDLSQLGWQAMVLDAGQRSGIRLPTGAIPGVQRFLRSVRAGRGGLASYRAGESSSRTMTAEALATRLLLGEDVPAQEISEAETYLLQLTPGRGQDNYYYWYYATLALHQMQDDAWRQWNEALKARLLATQRPDGSWPSSTLWGGYGGTVYTTAMATLCLETYYRHRLRESRQQVAAGALAPSNRSSQR